MRSRRIMTMLALLVLALSASGFAAAQTSGPDPDSPIKLETPSSDAEESADDESLEDETGGESGAATPVASEVVQLAAMTLDSNDLPSEWVLIQESYTSAEELIASLSGLI